MNKFNWSEEELLAYEQGKKRLMDEMAALAEKFDEDVRVGEERGIQIGHEKGRAEGRKDGREENQQQAKICLKLAHLET
ncbi:hypothetical protein [Wolbachia endosymbiont of Atemnus politus]|uniref:hypothetical protein n=1 Tax=Wolbachia endosymbiont of Atemnus politus TaxID=2682840 RepID=UPI001FEBCB06|nr:hypothetical protein [Wolbachia endosymbiont of Atemnus politus]